MALILLAETILGPLVIWMAYGDIPDEWTLGGGALLLATLVGHEVAGMEGATHSVDSATAADNASSSSGGAGVNGLFSSGAHRSPLLRPYGVASRVSSVDSQKWPSVDLHPGGSVSLDYCENAAARLVPLLESIELPPSLNDVNGQAANGHLKPFRRNSH